MRPLPETLPYVAGSDTSEAAAESMQPKAAAIRAKVYACIVEKEGATCDEVEAALGLRHQTASARIRELAKAGRLVDSGKRHTTRSGRKAVVWIATPDCYEPRTSVSAEAHSIMDEIEGELRAAHGSIESAWRALHGGAE